MLTARVDGVQPCRAPGAGFDYHVNLTFVGGGSVSLGPLPESHELVVAAKKAATVTFVLAELAEVAAPEAPVEEPSEEPAPAESKKARRKAEKES